MSFNKQTPTRYVAFLAALANTGNVSRACEAIECSRETVYCWRHEDPAFAARWDAAKKIGISGLEDEAVRRAYEGVDEPVFHQGQPTFIYERDPLTGEIIFDVVDMNVTDPETGAITTVLTQKPRHVLDKFGNPKVLTKKGYSDTLAIFLLKGNMPEKYKERIEHSGSIDIAKRILDARKRTGGE